MLFLFKNTYASYILLETLATNVLKAVFKLVQQIVHVHVNAGQYGLTHL